MLNKRLCKTNLALSFLVFPTFVMLKKEKIPLTRLFNLYMKKRILFYVALAISTISLQSCVSNYVVSAPNLYPTQSKTSDKLATKDSQK